MQDKISIKGAKVHNLKNIDVDIPHNKLTVITGLSGSGKTSLALDTIFAEGQRRFVESLSSYARQFLNRMPKPDVSKISGILPAIAIDQKAPSKNGRSTVGTVTEIYDYIRLLYGRIGKTKCKDCGQYVHQDTPQSISDEIYSKYDKEKIYIMYPCREGLKIEDEIAVARATGFIRIYDAKKDKVYDINEDDISKIKKSKNIYIIVDRMIIHKDEKESKSRFYEAIEAAFHNGNGNISIRFLDLKSQLNFSNKFECAECQIEYLQPEPRLFSFNNPFGACPKCQGFGKDISIDEDKVIPDKTQSLLSNPIAPWRTPAYKNYFQTLIYQCNKANIPLNVPYNNLSKEQQNFIWNGDKKYGGLFAFFSDLESNYHKIANRILVAKYRGYSACRDCGGSRLQISARQVYVGEKNIPEIIQYPIHILLEFFQQLKLNEFENQIAGQIQQEIIRRIKLLNDIGLEYLSLDRLTHTLSGGEAQRINLSSAIGSALTTTLYVLDEPSIGLHQCDTEKLIKILKELKNLGNTVIVIEHDPEIMKAADHIIDMGPLAGSFGGEVRYSGNFKGLLKSDTITADYLTKRKTIKIDNKKISTDKKITINKPRMNNLRMDKVEIPLGCLCAITGVSGSGKSTLINDFLYERLKKLVPNYITDKGEIYGITGYEHINNVEIIDQTPIGRSSRSTPVSYTKSFDAIREAFANTQLAKQLGYKAGHFSFNIPGGRCEECEGEGTVNIDMQFLPDIRLECEACKGTRYKKETRNILYNDKSIVDVLNMTVDEALEFFKNENKIIKKLEPLKNIGLNYLKLGQAASTLSGGEAQRIKLANYLEATTPGHNLFIFDEPTTGLHIDDINKLMFALRKLVNAGHSVLVIEHNLYVIANSDWIIDLGPKGGFGGGLIVAEGTPKQIIECSNSLTGNALKEFNN